MTVNKYLVLLLMFVPLCVMSQSRKELEKKRKATEEQIAVTKKILNDTKKQKQKNLNEIVSISRLIEKREELIGTISEEITAVSTDIDIRKKRVDSLTTELSKEKEQYAKAILQSYKSKQVYKNALYIFAAKSFNQAIMRLRFLRSLTAGLKVYIKKIFDRKKDIETEVSELTGYRIEQQDLMNSKTTEVKTLESDKQEKGKAVKSLEGKEKELRDKLAEQKKASDKLNAAIKDLIAKEIAEAARKRKLEEEKKKQAQKNTKTTDKQTAAKTPKETEKKAPAAKNEITATPEVSELSAGFASNRAKLPWPVDKGFISERFGTHPHPTLEQVNIANNGVDIQTSSGAVARAVFKGEVSAVISIPGMGRTVLVNHGDYFTVYAKLGEVSVKQGDKIEMKQSIGKILTDENGVTELHFELWLNQEKQNPEAWIVKK